MKLLRKFFPFFLILFYVLGAVFLFNNRKENAQTYASHLTRARHLLKNDILQDALEEYSQALEVHPNIDLAREVGQLYLDRELYKEAYQWYENYLHTAFPQEKFTYEYGIEASLRLENYRSAYQIYDEVKNRELSTPRVQELMYTCAYAFDLVGSYEDVGPFGNISGYAAVKNNGYWGYISKSGGKVLPYEYLYAGLPSKVASVVDEEMEAYFIDMDGNKKITEKSVLEKDPDLGRVKQFLGIQSGVFWASNGQEWFCYDGETYEKKFGGYNEVTGFSQGVCAVQNQEGKWALLSQDGTLLTPFDYDEVLEDQKNVVCRTSGVLVRQGDAYYLVDKQGERISQTPFEKACAFYDETYAAVREEGLWRFVDDQGVLQELGSYERARSFSSGYAAVYKDGKWGYIDLSGKLVLDYQFDGAGPFTAFGTAFVKEEGQETWSLLRLYRYNH